MHFSKRIAFRGINKGLVINDNRDNIPLESNPSSGKENNTTPYYTTLHHTTQREAPRHAAGHSWTQSGQTQNRECHNTRMDCISERYR